MQLITIDKYITYGVLEGLDVVDWVFGENDGAGAGADEADGWTDGHKWEILRMCLDKHSGRVAAVKKRLRTVERADEAARARRAADALERGGDVGDEDVEIDGKLLLFRSLEAKLIFPDAQPERSNEARDAQTSLDIQTTRLEKILLSTSKQFISTLLSSGDGEGLRAVLKLLDAGEEGWWSTRARFGWFREFVRRYQGHLGELKGVVERDVLHGMQGRAEEMVKDVWGSIL
jgi:nuclear cap-binding protein subunit 1